MLLMLVLSCLLFQFFMRLNNDLLFDALMLLVEQREGCLTGGNSAPTIPKSFLLGIPKVSFWRPSLNWSNFRKNA